MARETAETICQKAQQAIAEGRNEDARALFQQAIGLRADLPEAHYGLATVCFLMGELATSAFHFKSALEVRPNWEKALRGLEHAEVMAEETEPQTPASAPTQRQEAAGHAAPAAPVKVDPERLIDPNLHGDILRSLHRSTIDSET